MEYNLNKKWKMEDDTKTTQICAPHKNHGLSGVILEGQTPALNTKQTNKKVNIVFGRMG
jgi:hypothetical protein